MTSSTMRTILFATLLGVIFYLICAPIAYAQRGYLAFGGECVGILFPLFALMIADAR